MNTSAIKTPRLVSEAAEAFGSQCVVVAIDAKRDGPGRWRVYTHGGTESHRARRRGLGGRGSPSWSRERFS